MELSEGVRLLGPGLDVDTLAVAPAVLAFAAGLPAFAMTKVFQPGFYAREDTKTPMRFAIISVVINVVASLLLSRWYGHVGIAMATSIAAWVNAILLAISLTRITDALATDAAPLAAFVPVLDGKSLPVHPFDPVAPAQSASVPFLTGTTATETTFFDPDDQLMPIDDATLRQRVKALLKVEEAEADRMIALYRKKQPGRDNIDLYLRLETDNSRFRTAVDTQAERKAAQRGAPVYLYRFEYYSPVRQGRLKSMHCMEIPFVFDNLEAGKIYTGISPAAQRIADRMSAAWVAFARTGNPSHKGIPQWPAFDSTKRPTMVFGDEAKVVNDPGGEERLALKAIRDRQTRQTAE